MSTDETYREELMAARPKGYNERVELQRNARGELVDLVEPEPEDGPDIPEPEAEETVVEPQAPDLSWERRLENLEAFVAPRAVDSARQAQLDRHEQLVNWAHEAEPRELLGFAAQQAQQAAAEQLGLDAQAVDRTQVAAQATNIAVELVGPQRWEQVAPAVLQHMQSHPDVYTPIVERADPAEIGRTMIGVAASLQNAETVREAAEGHRAMKAQATTMSGSSNRPANLTGDEAYAASLVEFARTEEKYGR